MKVAVIGAGMMGSVHVTSFANMAGVEVVAVCDSDVAKANKLAKQANSKAYEDVDQMLREQDIDVVSVCLPTYLHKDMVVLLAQRGKHIICEKPLALTEEECQEMIQACQQAGVRLFVGHVVRFFHSYAAALGRVEAGAIGQPSMAHFKRYGAFPHGSRGWFKNTEQSGGVIVDLMIHDIDFARAIFGNPTSVYANIAAQEDTQYAQVTLNYADRSIVQLAAYWGYPGDFTTSFEITGSEGTIRYNCQQQDALEIRKKEQQGSSAFGLLRLSPLHQTPYEIELAHFIDSIRTDSESKVTAEDGLAAIRIARAAIRSAQSGQPIELEESK